MIFEGTILGVLCFRSHIEQGWMQLLERYSIETIAFVGLATSMLLGYFLGCMPYVVIDYFKISYFQQFKVQDSSFPDAKKGFRVSQVVASLFIFMVFPMIFGFTRTMGLLQIRVDAQLPSILEIVLSISFCLLVEDYLNYWIHRWLHTPWMYNNVHFMHHEHEAPFALTASYAHPIEIIALGIPTFTGPIILSPHLFTLWFWIMIRQYEAIDIHSGYELPWNLNRYLKFYAGTEHHDYHHHMYSGNFASIFTWCDIIYGTNFGYENFNLRRKLKDL